MILNLRFINTGLDDLIVKSQKAKTMKEVYVPPGNGHKGYVKEVPVNVEESKQPKANSKNKNKPVYKKKKKQVEPELDQEQQQQENEQQPSDEKQPAEKQPNEKPSEEKPNSENHTPETSEDSKDSSESEPPSEGEKDSENQPEEEQEDNSDSGEKDETPDEESGEENQPEEEKDEKDEEKDEEEKDEEKPPPELWNPFRPSDQQKAYKAETGRNMRAPKEVVDFCDENLKKSLLGTKITNMDGKEVTVGDFSEPHFINRFNLRVPEYIEQFTHGYLSEHFKRKYNIDISDPTISDDKRKFDVQKNHFIQINTKLLAKTLCNSVIKAINQPVFKARGDCERTGGSTVYAGKDAAIVIGNNGEIVTFWFQPLGKRFAISKGWKGYPPPLSRFLTNYKDSHPELKYNWNQILEHDDENPRFFLDTEFKGIYNKIN